MKAEWQRAASPLPGDWGHPNLSLFQPFDVEEDERVCALHDVWKERRKKNPHKENLYKEMKASPLGES
jgi:hypothetical protein